MSGNLQPKSLYELAFRSFITYMENEALQLMKLRPSPEAVSVTSRVCGELKRFFHGTRLPTSITNQLTKHLLIKLDYMHCMFESSIHTECCQQMLLSLVEVFMYPDVTAIELGQSYFHEFLFKGCSITWIILQKVCNLHNLKVLNLPGELSYGCPVSEPVFPSQLKELTVLEMNYDMLRCIVKFCPELKNLTICECKDLNIPLLLQCKNLETLRISRIDDKKEDIGLKVIEGLSTETAATLKSFSLRLWYQSTLHLIVDKLPHLTEIELICKSHIDLSSLTQLKNLRSLSLDAFRFRTRKEYKKILPVLGKNLVFLELRGQCALDLELIGETCTHLKCLHLSDIVPYVNPSWKTIPNFKTIECLKITSRDAKDMVPVPFLIAQCVNIKTLIVNFSRGAVSKTIEDVLRRTPPLDWVVIMHGPAYENDDFIVSLPSRHPNFHVVKTYYWMRLSSQSDLFDFFYSFRSYNKIAGNYPKCHLVV